MSDPKEKNNKLGYIKIKSSVIHNILLRKKTSCSLQQHIYRKRKKPSNYTVGKHIIYIIIQLFFKEKNRKWAKEVNTHFTREKKHGKYRHRRECLAFSVFRQYKLKSQYITISPQERLEKRIWGIWNYHALLVNVNWWKPFGEPRSSVC